MAKRKSGRSTGATRSTKKSGGNRQRSAKRPKDAGTAARRAKSASKKPGAAKKAAPRNAAAKAASRRQTTGRSGARAGAKTRSARSTGARKAPRLNRDRRILDERPVLPSPPSSLDLDRHSSAARSGRAAMEESQREHRGMTGAIAAGDADVDVEEAYFSGEEAPGGDNPTPDQDVVDDIGKALGVEYADNEELKASDKITQRDKHRWELDPASAEDYKERK